MVDCKELYSSMVDLPRSMQEELSRTYAMTWHLVHLVVAGLATPTASADTRLQTLKREVDRCFLSIAMQKYSPSQK